MSGSEPGAASDGREHAATAGKSITLVTHYFASHRGGVEAIAAALANGLCADHDYRIDWFASDCDEPPSGDRASALRCHPCTSWNGLESALGLPWPVWGWSAFAKISAAVQRSTFVHVHDFIYFGNLVAVFFALRYGKPLVVTQHIGFIPYQSRVRRAVLSMVNRVVGGFVLGRATTVVFYSAEVQRYFSRFVRWKAAPAWIENGVDVATYFPLPVRERAALRAQHQLAGTPVFLFVGRFTEKKGLTLLRAFASALTQVQWIVVGHGEERPEDWNLPNVRVFRGLSGATLAPWYQMADLLVLPSRGEGFPLVVQEAMACGTPAFVSSETAAAAPEARPLLFHEDCSGMAAQKWIERLQALSDVPAQLDPLRAEVEEFVHRSWGMASSVAAYARLFESLAGAGAGRR